MKFEFFLINEFPSYTSVILNRPKSKNAFNLGAIHELTNVLTLLSSSETPIVIFDTHPNGYFCSGGDLKEFSGLKTELQGFEMASKMASNLEAIESLSAITISVLSGSVFGGGCELALSTDMAYATSSSKFGFTQAKFGLPPGWNGMGRLIQRIGYSKSMHLLLNKSIITGEDAHQIGIVDAVFSSREALITSVEELSNMPSSILFGIKEAAKLYKAPLSEEAKKRELLQFAKLWGADIHHELVQDFFKNKKPTLE